MDVTDYVEAAVLGEGAKRPNDVPQSYVGFEEIVLRLQDLLESHVENDVIEQIIERLIQVEVLKVIDDEVAGNFYKFDQNKLVAAFNGRRQDQKGLVYKYASIGPRFLRRALEAFQDPNAGENDERPVLDEPADAIPASDRVVRLDDNSLARDELLGRLEELEAAVRGHNGDEGQLGSERERVLAEIKSGEELLKAPSVRVRAIWTVLGGALAFIASEFAGGMIGELATLLLEALRVLLGI